MAGKHFKGPVNEQVFSEHPIVNHLYDEHQTYDITGKQVGTFDFEDGGKFSHADYPLALLIKLTSLSESRINEFIAYQLEKITDRKTWLQELETLIEINAQGLETYKPGVVSAIKAALKDALSAGVSKSAPQIRWKGKDAELLKLIISLAESGSIEDTKGKSNVTAALHAFEDMLGIQVKDHWKKIEKFKSRKRSQSPFLTHLTASFEQWVAKR